MITTYVLLKPILKPLEECARAQLISQCVDAGQLNVPLQQRPIRLSLTRVMLN